MTTKIPVSEALDALRVLRNFRAGTYLRAERFWRLSPDPIGLGGLNPVQQAALLHARQINETHYMPYCAICNQRIDYDTSMGGLRTWLHKEEVGSTHIVEPASHPDSYNPDPAGLAYVVWAGRSVIAWVHNDGTVVHIGGSDLTRYRTLAREALGERIEVRHQ